MSVPANPHGWVERRAWLVMWSALAAFCVSLVGLVAGVRWFVFESESPLWVSTTLVTGLATIKPAEADLPQLLIGTLEDLSELTQLETNAGAQVGITFYAPDRTTAIAFIQVYGGSNLWLVLARTPRFAWSSRPDRIELQLQSGRARINPAADVQQPIVMTIRTPHGTLQIERAGSYFIETSDRTTEVMVREGVATVSGNEQSVTLASGERTRILAGESPNRVLTGERNLIANSNFASPLSAADWRSYVDQPSADEAAGQFEQALESGRNVARFVRLGRNWGRVGIVQQLNRDLRGYERLNLHLTLKIVQQSLTACGTYGSECPIMIKLTYSDPAGNPNEWVQGFYYLADAGNGLPIFCYTCPPPRSDHILVQQDTWYSYDSPNLMALLNQPALISSLSIYAEGHSFESLVAEVELQASD